MAKGEEEPEVYIHVVTVQEAYDSMTAFQKKAVEILCNYARAEGVKQGRKAKLKT